MDVFEEENGAVAENTALGNDEIEKATYSKLQYRAVTRLREKGAEYGVQVPFLKHPLTKSEGSNVWLKTFIILSGVLIAAGVAALIWALVSLIPSAVEILTNTNEVAGSVQQLPLIGSIVGLSNALVWTIAIAIPVLAVAIIAYCLAFIFKLQKISTSFVEEKAHGHVVTNLKIGALVGAIAFFVFAVLGIALFKVLAVTLVCAVVSAYAVALFAVLQIERSRARVEFDKLPEKQKSDYIEYAKALRHAASTAAARKRYKATVTTTSGKHAVLNILLDGYLDASIVYDNLKKNTLYKDTSTGLARRSLQHLLVFALTTVFTLLISYWALTSLSSFWEVLIMIIAVVGVVYAFVISFPLALYTAVKQLRLNKKPLGKVALALCLVLLAAMIIGAVILFTHI